MKGQTKQLGILVLIAIAASGCASTTTQTDTSSSTGVLSVNSFEASPDPASADRRVNINMELENTGDADAERVAARIFGPTFSRSGSADDQAWRDSSGGTVSVGERTVFFDSLRAPSENVPAVPKSKSISLTAPDLGQGREIDYGFNAKIFYQYETTGSTDFQLVSGERFQSEGLERTATTVDASSGPISLDIRGTTPKIFYPEENDGTVESEICIRVTNEGSGTPFRGGTSGLGTGSDSRIYSQNSDAGYEENTVRLEIDDVANVDFDLQGDESGNSADIELVGGEEGFQCFDMTAENLAGSDEQNVNTQITAEYNYVKETTTSVTVEGRRGGGTDEPADGSDGDGSDEGPGAPPTPGE